MDYKTERSLLKHYFTDHGTVPTTLQNTKKYICSKCPKIYTKKRSLDAHKREKHSTSPLKKNTRPKPQVQCPYCEKLFTTNVAARNHIIGAVHVLSSRIIFILSKFILILFWLWPDFILILSWFYSDFILILILSWFYPNFTQILSHRIRLKYGQNPH